MTDTRELIPQKPIPGEVALVDPLRYNWRTHVFDQMAERNISPYEVLAALEFPDVVQPSRTHEGHLQYLRGDVKVMFDPSKTEVRTVGGRNGDHIPRKPLIPQGEPVNIAQFLPPATRHQLEAMAKQPPPQEPAPENHQVEAEKQPPKVAELRIWMEEQIQAMEAGHRFRLTDLRARVPARIRHQYSTDDSLKSSSVRIIESFARDRLVKKDENPSFWVRRDPNAVDEPPTLEEIAVRPAGPKPKVTSGNPLREYIDAQVEAMPDGQEFVPADLRRGIPAAIVAEYSTEESMMGCVSAILSIYTKRRSISKLPIRGHYCKGELPQQKPDDTPQPEPEAASIPEQEDRDDQLLEAIQADRQPEQTPETAVEVAKPSAVELFYGDTIKNHRAVRRMAQELVGALEDLEYDVEYTMNNLEFTIVGRRPQQ